MDYFYMVLKLIIAMIIVIGSLLIISKLASSKVSKINETKYIKILERSQIGKNAFITIVKVGDKGYLLSVCDGKIEKLDVVSKDEIEKLELSKKMEMERVQSLYEGFYENCKMKCTRLIKRFTRNEKK